MFLQHFIRNIRIVSANRNGRKVEVIHARRTKHLVSCGTSNPFIYKDKDGNTYNLRGATE